jgi:hypothetical protein
LSELGSSIKAAPDDALSASNASQWIERWNWGAVVFTPPRMRRKGFPLSLLN